MQLNKKSKIISFLLIIVLCVATVGNYSYADNNFSPHIVTICGFPIGIKLEGDGVTVTGYMTNDARQSGLNVGDRIISINGLKINSSLQLQNELNNKTSDFVELEVIDAETSDNKVLSLRPLYDAVQGSYRLGVWVKDSAAGIGTMTFYDKSTHVFGSLGHGITDCGDVFPISGGSIQEVTIFDIEKGHPGEPGELKGYFNDVNNAVGIVCKNTPYGVYGYISDDRIISDGCFDVEVAKQGEVHTGNAYIFANIDGEKFAKYEIKISAVNKNQENATKTLSILVTDNELICKTGGIVQGMSGSPIIQDGKLVGAVTHVMINDPTVGYGILIENMLNAAQMPMAKAS